MKEELYEYFILNNNNIEMFEYIEILTVAFILSLVIFFTYKYTFSGVMYSRKFNISLIMITLITTIVILVIGSNIALSLGMVGALSIVRFRTAIKDPRDTSYIFWAIAIGLCSGTTNYMIAIFGSIILCLVLIIINIGGLGKEDRYILIIRGLREREEEMMKCVFDAFKGSKLRAKNSSNDKIEIIYEIRIKKNKDKNLLADLYSIEGVAAVNLVAQNGETIG